jgi:hypothetical protein
MERATCHASGAQSFEVVTKFLENVCTPVRSGIRTHKFTVRSQNHCFTKHYYGN